MAGKAHCGECNKELAGEPNLYMGGDNRAGRLCIPCLDRLVSTNGVPSKPSNFVQWYIRSKTMDPKDRRIKELEERLHVLEAMVAERAPGLHQDSIREYHPDPEIRNGQSTRTGRPEHVHMPKR